MTRLLRIITRILLTFFCLFLLLLILKQFLPIEYADNEVEYFFGSLVFYGFPIALLLTLFLTVKQKDNLRAVVAKIFFTILIGALSFFIMLGAAIAGNMCGWSVESVLFENKQNSSIKIVDRNFDCGATDSGEPIHTIFKIRKLTSYFIWATKIDTNSIDKSKWNRIIKTSE